MASLIERSKGTDFVPETGPAILHRGEAVITAAANKKRMKRKHNSIEDIVAKGSKH